MAAADVAPQFGAELKVSLLEDDGCRCITNWLNLPRIPSNRSTVGYGPPTSFPRSQPVRSPYMLEVELMQTCCTGIKWYIMGRRNTPILPRAECD